MLGSLPQTPVFPILTNHFIKLSRCRPIVRMKFGYFFIHILLFPFPIEAKEHYEAEMVKWNAEQKETPKKPQKNPQKKPRTPKQQRKNKYSPRKRFEPIKEEQQIKVLQYVRNNAESLYSDWSNGRPKNAQITAWKEAYNYAIGYISSVHVSSFST